jgi:hypothetical protein
LKTVAIVAALSLLALMPLGAQGNGPPLRVRGRQALAFTTLLPGVPELVSRIDAARSGQLEIRGRKNTLVMLQFVLPREMIGPGGAILPLAFGPDDAGFTTSRRRGSQVGFDPSAPFTVGLPQNGHGFVFIGGTAQPQPNQRAGSYSATVTLLVADPGT